MRTLKAIGENGKKSTVSLGVAVKNLLYTDEVPNFRETLDEILLEWLCSENACDRYMRADFIMRARALDVLLTAIDADGEEVMV